jgi:hypothetical protein
VIQICKVQWREDEATWEREEELRIEFPHLFPSPSYISRTRFLLRGVGFVIPKFVSHMIGDEFLEYLALFN